MDWVRKFRKDTPASPTAAANIQPKLPEADLLLLPTLVKLNEQLTHHLQIRNLQEKTIQIITACTSILPNLKLKPAVVQHW